MQFFEQITVKVMSSSREQAQAGVDQAAHAGESLGTIAEAVTRITDMSAQIATAAEEQSAVTEEIDRNINSIAHSAQETYAGSTETAQASANVSQLAEHLGEMIGRLKV